MEGSQDKPDDNAKKGWRISVIFAKGGSQSKTEDSEKETRKLDVGAGLRRTTTFGFVAGLLFGGIKEASSSSSVRRDVEWMSKLWSLPDKLKNYDLMAYFMREIVTKVTPSALLSGVYFGMFSASFSLSQQRLEEYRGVDDVYNIIAAGSATGAVLGLSIPGSYRSRARNMAFGSVLGAAVGFPLGWVNRKLAEKRNEGKVTDSEEGVDAEGGEE